MSAGQVVCGLLDISSSIQEGSLSEWARSLTVSWLRFKYSGEILESADLNELLDLALESGYRYCLLQCYGHLILEHWQPGDEHGGVFPGPILQEMEQRKVPVLISENSAANVPHPSLMLVNLLEYRKAGKPRYPSAFFGGSDPSRPVVTGWSMVDLCFGSPDARKALAAYRGMSILAYPARQENHVLAPEADAFLREIKSATQNSQRGIFLWNFEPYSDIEDPPPGFHRPLSCLYSVAAGLKSNRILETHSFDSQTRVVIFDYSAPGLQFKRLLLQEWDGSDYPEFIRRIREKLPPGEAYYWLWENPDQAEMERLWSQEVDRWGGEQNLRDHWKHYRKLKHQFVICNLLDDRRALLNAMNSDPNSAIWWSNAFS